MPRKQEFGWGARLAWFRESYGVPWLFGHTGHTSKRQFYIAMGINSPTGISWEVHSRTPDRAKIDAVSLKMGYDQATAESNSVWLLTGHGQVPPTPPGVTGRTVPLPKADGSSRQPMPPNVERSNAPADAPNVPGVLEAQRLAGDVLEEAAEKGEKLSAKVLELVRAVRGLPASGRKALAGLALAASLLFGGTAEACGVAGASGGTADAGDLKSDFENDSDNESEDETGNVRRKGVRKPVLQEKLATQRQGGAQVNQKLIHIDDRTTRPNQLPQGGRASFPLNPRFA